MLRVKKSVKIALASIGLVSSIGVYSVLTKEEIIPEPTMEELIVDISIDGIEQDFLYWLNDTYPDDFVVFYNQYLEGYDQQIWHQCFEQSYLVLTDQYNEITESIVLEGNTVSVTGDVSFADNYYGGDKYDESGIEGMLSQEILDYFFDQSLVVANAEFAVGEGGTPTPDKYFTFLGSKDRAGIFLEMNAKLVTLANNHTYDYGEDVFPQTLAAYEEYGIESIGAGMNLDEASEAAYYVINGYKFAFVNANRSEKFILTPGATDESEGVVRCYDPEHFISMIEAEDEKADYVIAIIHWGLENYHDLEDVLLETSHMYIDAGADAIIGHHAHVLQGIEYYDDKPIFYNLGNFLFGREKVEGGIASLEINDDGSIDYDFLPTLQDAVYTDFLYDQEALDVIEDMNSWSINAYIDEQGNVLPLEEE